VYASSNDGDEKHAMANETPKMGQNPPSETDGSASSSSSELPTTLVP
jgi:hypothetical protein